MNAYSLSNPDILSCFSLFCVDFPKTRKHKIATLHSICHGQSHNSLLFWDTCVHAAQSCFDQAYQAAVWFDVLM